MIWIVAKENWSFGSFENEVRQFAGDTPTLTFLLWVSKQDPTRNSAKLESVIKPSVHSAKNIIRLYTYSLRNADLHNLVSTCTLIWIALFRFNWLNFWDKYPGSMQKFTALLDNLIGHSYWTALLDNFISYCTHESVSTNVPFALCGVFQEPLHPQ